MNILQRMHWWLTGEIAEMVVDYDSVGEAIGLPVVAWVASSAMMVGAHTAQSGSYWWGVLAAVWYLFAAIMGFIALLATAATVVYVREQTEIPVDGEGVV